jgi:hypothetical protein
MRNGGIKSDRVGLGPIPQFNVCADSELCAPTKADTFAQTILSLSFFAYDKAADHTFRFAIIQEGTAIDSDELPD